MISAPRFRFRRLLVLFSPIFRSCNMWKNCQGSLYIGELGYNKYLFIVSRCIRVIMDGYSRSLRLFRIESRQLHQRFGKFKSGLFHRVTIMSGMSSSSIVWSEPFVGKLDSASMAWWFVTIVWTISKSDSTNWSLQSAGLPVVSARFSIQRWVWWSVPNVNIAHSEYKRKNRIAQTTERQSRCLVSWFCSCSVRVCD